MADICIVYAKETKKIANMLFELLSQQWDVWMDKKIVGSFRKAIEKELPCSGCVVAVNSMEAREKDEYTAELQIAKDHKVPIIPVRLDDSKLPYPFGENSQVDMQDWAGEPDHSGFIELKTKIAQEVPPKERPQRPNAIANCRLPLPSVFMSVSSYETRLKPIRAIKALCAFGTPTILVSAYDLARDEKPQALIDTLNKCSNNGAFILLDSGIYEAYRLRDNYWNENDFMEVLNKVQHDMAFSFDSLKPCVDSDKYVLNITKRIRKHQNNATKPVIPIIHVPKTALGLDEMPKIVSKVSEVIVPPIIAIPERELGAGILARARSIRKIRKELNKLPNYQPIHILGTGHPWSIAILAAAGADTFDGLEWCRYTIDHDNEVISHFHHFDLLSEIKGTRIGFSGKIAYHNLEYYKMFGDIIHDMFVQNSVESFVRGVLNKKAFNRLKYEFPELFKTE